MSTATLTRPPHLEGLQVGDTIRFRGADGVLQERRVQAISDGQVTTKIGNVRWDDPSLEVIGAMSSSPPPGGEPAPYAMRHIPAMGFVELELDRIRPSDLNPRSLDGADLSELAGDIRARGLINPITVREIAGDPAHQYEVISGERRFRASILAGLTHILARNRGPLSAEEAYEETIRENAQRSDLGPLEECRAIDQMLGFGWEQARIGKLLGGKSQSWVSRTQNLGRLPGPVQAALAAGRLTRSAAEELAALARWPKEQVRLAEDAVTESWTAAHLAEIVGKRKRTLEAQEAPPLPEFEPEAPAPVELEAPAAALEAAVASDGPPVVEEAPTAPPLAEVVDLPQASEPEAPVEPVAAPTPPVQTEAPTPAPAPTLGTTGKPGSLKSAEEIVAEKAGAAVPTTTGAAPLDAPVTMCMVTQDCVAWLRADDLTAKEFLLRAKAAAYHRGQNAADLLASLED